jgi:hypothetical protein
MIFACGYCGGVVEIAAAGGVLGLAGLLTQLWNKIRRGKRCHTRA